MYNDHEMEDVKVQEISSHEDMVMVINTFNSLPGGEKKIILASLGQLEDISEWGKIIQEIVSARPHDYKAIFIELLKNNAKLSWGAGDSEKGSAQSEDKQE